MKRNIKIILISSTLIISLLISMIYMEAASTNDGVKYEFENGIQNGAEIKKDYVGETDSGEKVDLTGSTCTFLGQKGTKTSVDVVVEKTGLYEVFVRYAQPFDKSKKIQYLNVNGVNQGEVSFTYSTSWKEISAGIVKLNAGKNNIEFEAYWGYTYFDYLIVKTADESITSLKVEPSLVNPNSSNEAKALMSYLTDVYGKNILSGQQEYCGSHNYEGSEAEFTYIKEKTGKMPAVRGFDFMNYRGNNLLWDDECAERVIDWYNNKNGIPTVCYHWFSPADIGKKGDGSFYTDKTTFSISKALTAGTEENIAMLKDIEVLAGKFKQLKDAGVPVLFRPLHEAEGGWFWWGAEGSEPCVKLYRLLYDQFTNKYGLNNIIWVWTSYTYETSPKWYPGNDVVDIVGYDKYNAKDGLPNGSAISSTFYNLAKLTNGKKLVTMSENDTIPRVANLQNEMAGWLYFCPWYNWWLTGAQNNPVDWLVEMYKSEYCITLDELPKLKDYKSSSTKIPSTSSVTNTPTSSIIIGDVNLDKIIRSTDSALIARHILGMTDLVGDSLKAADTNKDGRISSSDISLLERYLLGSINSL